MGYANTGIVHVRRYPDRLEVNWTANASGAAVLNGIRLDDVIERVVSPRTIAASSSATHSVELLDELDGDVLVARCTALADDAATPTTVSIYKDAGGNVNLPVHAMGMHAFRVSAADVNDAGVTKIYLRPAGSFERYGD